MDAQAAARFGDEIAHGFGVASMVAGAVVGALVGAAVIGVVAATGGVAAVILGGAIAAGGLSGAQLVKGLATIFNLPEPTSGTLARGSPNVAINGRRAMRAGDDAAASCNGLPFNHPPWPAPVTIAQGSRRVRINGRPAARVTNKLSCGAHIKSGSPNVFIGGPDADVAAVFDLEAWLHSGLEALGAAALIGGGVLAAAAGAVAFGIFAGATAGVMAAFEGLGRLGDRFGPGYRDLLQGTAGMAALLAGPKVARYNLEPKIQNKVLRVTAEQADYLKFLARSEFEALLAAKQAGKLTNAELGPALSVAQDLRTGKISRVWRNNPTGEAPVNLSEVLATRWANAPDNVLKFERTHGMASHAEIYAVNELLMDRPGASLSDFAVFTMETRIPKFKGEFKPACIQCN